MTFVVMAAGLGSRYGGRKQLDTFGQRQLTIAEYNMEQAIAHGFSRFIFVINESYAEIFHRRLSQFLPKNCSFILVYQKTDVPDIPYARREKPWGTGHALLCCRKWIDGVFCVTNADDLYGEAAIALMAEQLQTLSSKKACFTNVAYVLKNTLSESGAVNRGILEVDKEGHLVHIQEKLGITFGNLSELSLKEEALVSMNLWGFTPAIFPLLERYWDRFLKQTKDLLSEEFGLPDVIAQAVAHHECQVQIVPTHSQWHGVTYPSDKATLEASL